MKIQLNKSQTISIKKKASKIGLGVNHLDSMNGGELRSTEWNYAKSLDY